MCICCNNKDSKTFQVKDRCYGSIFDCTYFKIELCDSCIKKFNIQNEWFDEKPNEFGEYTYEENIFNLIYGINLHNKLLTNKCSSNIIEL